MSNAIVYVDRSDVHEGAVEEVKALIKELVDFIDDNVPKAIAYHIYLDEPGTQMTVFQIQPDSAAMEFHMEVGGPVFRKFRDLITLRTIDVYGNPSESLLDQLHQKAKMLGDGTVVVHELQAGFSRFEAR